VTYIPREKRQCNSDDVITSLDKDIALGGNADEDYYWPGVHLTTAVTRQQPVDYISVVSAHIDIEFTVIYPQ